MFSILLGIELLLLTKPNDYSYKRKYIESHLDGIKMLFIGHSCFELGVDPSVLGDSVFNSALSGRGAGNTWDVQFTEKYVPIMPNLKDLVLPLNYHTVYEIKSKGIKGDSFKCMSYKYLGLKTPPLSFIYWSEILNSKLDFWGRIANPILQCDSLGQIKYEKEDRFDNWRTHHLPKISTDSIVNTRVLDDILKIAQICEENNIRLTIITTPVYITYQNLLTEKWKNDMATQIENLQKAYPKVRYKNYTFDKRFIDDDFKDAGHLNEIGAKKFSEIIKEELFCREKTSGYEKDI